MIDSDPRVSGIMRKGGELIAADTESPQVSTLSNSV
jgi:hypothetical protein